MGLKSLPTCQHSAIFRAIAQAIRANSAIVDNVDTIIDWQGVQSRRDEAVDPPSGQAWIRLTPVGVGERWASSNQQQSDLRIRVETSVPGTRVEDALDLWAAIGGGAVDPNGQPVPSALFPGDRSLYAGLTDLGAQFYGISSPAISPHADGACLRSEGSIDVSLRIRTRV